ncbi:hypothetical protein Ciccas_009351, partial [Cichlidogyrus casuarinus]
CPKATMLKRRSCERDEKEGRSYEEYESTSYERENCICVPKSLKTRKLCGCSDKRQIVRQCQKAQLRGEHGPKAVLEEISIYEKPLMLQSAEGVQMSCETGTKKKLIGIECPQPIIKYRNCINGRMPVRILYYDMIDCKCHQVTKEKVLKCDSSKEGTNDQKKGEDYLLLPQEMVTDCTDLLPQNRCEQMNKAPYNELKHGSYKVCQSACTSNSQCQSFDLYMNSSGRTSCVLSSATPQSLLTSEFSGDTKEIQLILGASRNDLQTFQADRCIFVQKTCKKQQCPADRFDTVKECSCEQVPGQGRFLGEGLLEKHQHCSRRVKVTKYTRDREGNCKAIAYHREFPCGHSEIEYKCQDKAPAEKCPFSCKLCQCDKAYSYRTECNEAGNYVINVLQYSKDPRLNFKCVLTKKQIKQACDYCPGEEEEVLPCKPVFYNFTNPGGKATTRFERIVRTTRSTLDPRSNKCHKTVSEKRYSCGGCASDDRQTIKRGRDSLILTKLYQVNENGCCKTKSSSREYDCRSCPKPVVKSTVCVDGLATSKVTFYVRFDEKKDCVANTLSKTRQCQSPDMGIEKPLNY